MQGRLSARGFAAVIAAEVEVAALVAEGIGQRRQGAAGLAVKELLSFGVVGDAVECQRGQDRASAKVLDRLEACGTKLEVVAAGAGGERPEVA